MVSRKPAQTFVLALVLGILASNAAWAAVGKIAGRVTSPSGEGLSANVIVLGTKQGAAAKEDGSFLILNVPVGTYDLKAIMPGKNPLTKSVTVDADKTAFVNFTLTDAVTQVKEVVVSGQRKLINVKSSTTSSHVDAQSLKTLPVDSFTEAIALKPGIVAQAGQLHVRGGRAERRSGGFRCSSPFVRVRARPRWPLSFRSSRSPRRAGRPRPRCRRSTRRRSPC